MSEKAEAAEAVAHERHRHERAEHRRDRRREQGDLQRLLERGGEVGIPEGVRPVAQREPVPGEVEAALVVVEREQDDDEDRDEQVQQRGACQGSDVEVVIAKALGDEANLAAPVDAF